MGNEITTFGECSQLITDSIQPDLIDPGTPYIGLQHIAQDELRLIEVGKASDVSSNKYIFKKGDILFGKLRPYFRKVIIAPFDGVCSTDIWVVRATKKCDQTYLFYWMASQEFVDIAHQGSQGTKMPRAKWDYVSKIKRKIPKIDQQRKIGEFLRSFDDKIELNQRMNHTLEEIARAIFKSWFVDFDPVRAKMAGKPHPLPDEVMALFPDRLVESELGMIPKGWEVKSLDNVAYIFDCLHSKKPSQKRQGKVLLQVFNIGKKGRIDLSKKFYISEEDYNTWTRRFEASSYDMVISKTGRVGAIAQIPLDFNAALGRNLVGIRAKKKIIYETFLRDLMLSEFMEDEIHRKTSLGTILRSIHVKNISTLKLVKPQKDLQRIYKAHINPIHDRINLNIFCNEVLSTNRDDLLCFFFSNNEYLQC
jgi:type I restriction enzyme, S subunit